MDQTLRPYTPRGAVRIVAFRLPKADATTEKPRAAELDGPIIQVVRPRRSLYDTPTAHRSARTNQYAPTINPAQAVAAAAARR